MKTFQITIEGTSPLLLNRYSDAAMEAATRGTRSAFSGDKLDPREEAEQKLYKIGGTGAPCIPQPNLLRCLIDAGTFFKSGKNKLTTQKSSIIPAAVSVQGAELPIEHRQPWSVDIRACVIPSTGGRVARVRPRFDDWRLTFTADIEEDILGAQLFRQLVDAAGKKIGLGDFRPARKGPFGRFVVVSWEQT